MFELARHTIALTEFETSTGAHLTAEELQGMTTADLIEDEVQEVVWGLMDDICASELLGFLESVGFDIMDDAPRFRSEDEMDQWIADQMDWMTDELSHSFSVDGDQVEIVLGH